MPYIIESDLVIWSIADTEANAWHNFQADMRSARIFDRADCHDDCSSTYDLGDFRATRATPALIAQVEHGGGATTWRHLPDGTACTLDESEATQ